ncbi:tetratricopeptide repeat protein, partial [Streptomyces sp. DT225]
LDRAEDARVQHERVITCLDAPECPVTGHAADTYRAIATGALGHDYAALGRWHEAAEFYRETVDQAHRTGQTILEGLTLLGLGEALNELGEAEEARSCFRQV